MRAAALIALLVAAAPAAAQIPSQDDWPAARQSLVTADGLTLTYVEIGPQAAGDPLLLLHGYTDNSRAWSLLMPHLGDRRIIALDLRGHGGSEAPPCCYGLDSLARDLAQAMDALGIARADIAGHSLGAMAAAVLAAQAPARVDDLVLVSGALSVPPGPADWLWQNVPALEAPIDPDGEFMLAWYWNPNPVDEDFLARARAESAATPLHVWTGVLEALTLTDWSLYAPRVAADTLILWGDQDSLFDAAAQERLRAALPAAIFEAHPGRGHNLLWEAPAEVGARIAAFLDG
jgi:pimeloyl-ACP methyl ester carboxylesterase